MPSRPIHLSWSQYDPHFPSASHAGSVLVSPVATTSPFATWPPTGTDARRRTPTGCCDVVGGTGLGAGHSTDDVADTRRRTPTGCDVVGGTGLGAGHSTDDVATWPPTGADARRRTPTGCCDVVGGTGLGAGHSTDDVADRSNVVVEVGARADDRRTLVADLLQALRGHRLERSTDDREAFQQVGEVGGAEGEETAVRGRPDAGHSSPSS